MDVKLPDGDWRQVSPSIQRGQERQGKQGDPEDPEDISKRAKRLPHTRSCDTCKRMKIRCERRADSCVHCIDRGVKCETTLVVRKKRPKRSISTIEQRIKNLESVLTLSGINVQQSSSPDTTGEVQSDLTDKLSDLLIDDAGSSRFIGPSSGLSLFSPQGLRWISERTGSNELSELITSFGRGAGGPWSQFKVNFWHPIPPCDREPLPSRELADKYVLGFFDHFNSIFPLYNRASFDEFLEHQYSGQPLGGVEWYASLNVVLCLGSMILLVDERQSQGYFRNACGCFIDLMFKGSNLMALQAICGLAMIQQFYLEPENVYILSATASRLAYAMGLHHKLGGFGLSQQDVQQRYNVFWIVYVMDKTIALRFGHPSIMRDDDIGIDLPHQDTLCEEDSDGLKRFNMFRYHAELAQLESRVYSELYSVRARSKPTSNRLAAVGELDKALQEWRLALPQEIRPGEPIQYAGEHFPPLAMMHFAYFNCLTTIHRSSVYHGSWTSDDAGNDEAVSQDSSLNPRVYASYSICLTAARKSIELLNMFDKKYSSGLGNLAGMAMYYPVTGFLTLFANTLQNPQSACASADLELMDVVLSRISAIAIQGSSFSRTNASRLFTELGRVASNFVERTQCNLKKSKRVNEKVDAANAKRRPCPRETDVVDTSHDPKHNSALPDFLMPTTSHALSQFSTSDMSISPFTSMPQQNFIDPQHLHQAPSYFESDMLSLPDEFSFLPQDPSLYNQATIFTGYVEWDLANLLYGPPTGGFGAK